jgi:CDP-diacylglycerol--serine O-phosphatidyltransferase
MSGSGDASDAGGGRPRHPVLRFLADTLSAGNLVCGLVSIGCAAAGRFELSLGFLLAGAVLDGLDGLAARRFGGTRIGVYADDVADGVNNGVAPGVALYFKLGGVEGVAIGAFFTVFTLTRLVYFTLAKGTGDPRYFHGVPSTIGALIALASILVFPEEPALIGLSIGIACAQMVSWKTHYRHLGRALASRDVPPVYAGAALAVLIGFGLAYGVRGASAIILAASVVYGFLPSVLGMRAAMRPPREERQDAPRASGPPR